ncbi:MAG: hypothetical protein WCA09_00410 [Burkholderiales bacterium]
MSPAAVKKLAGRGVRQFWTLALFLKHMDKLRPAVEQSRQQVPNWPLTSVHQADQK